MKMFFHKFTLIKNTFILGFRTTNTPHHKNRQHDSESHSFKMKSSLSFVPVYNSLWHLTHFVFNIIYLVYQKLIAPLLILKIIYLKIKNKGENDTVNSFKLNKLPQHLTVVIAENEIYVDTFVYLITWCQQLNISYLSIYINNGKIIG